jgi:chromosome segregation ATPase
VDTEARESALLRRIEELAALAGDEPERAETPVVAAALTGLRAELGSLRADVGSLRAELSAIRAGVDGAVSRLSAEIADLQVDPDEGAQRHSELTERIGEINTAVGEVASTIPDLRGGLDRVPERTGAIEDAIERLESALTQRVDTLAADLRRTLTSGLTQASAGARAAETAVTEARSVLEERLAAVEDATDGLAEGLEAVTRDGIAVATDRIGQVEQRIVELAGTTEATLAGHADAQQEWAGTVRDALSDLGAALDRNLGSLGESIGDAFTSARTEQRAHVDELLEELRTVLSDAFALIDHRLTRDRHEISTDVAALRGFVETFQTNAENRLETLNGALGSGFADARAALVDELSSSIGELTSANAGTRRMVEDELAALRTDLADALEEVRDRVAASLTDATDLVTGTVEEQRSSFDELVRGLRTDVLDRVEQSRGDVLSALDDLRAGAASAARSGEEAAARSRDLEQAVAAFDETISQLRGEWAARSESAVSSARAAAEAATREFRLRAEESMTQLREAMDRHTAAVDDTAGVLNGGVSRLVTAGQALLGYLAQRDEVMEQQRAVTLHELLDAFAEGLSAKERRWAAARLGDALDRRRDARDADKWRRTAAGAPPEVPAPPADLASLAATPAPRAIRGSAQRRAAAQAAAEAPAPAKAAAKKTPKKPAKKTAKKTVAPGKAAAAATSTTTKKAATPAVKKATKSTPPVPTKSVAPKPAAPRRSRSSLTRMPEVPSPDVALDAAVGPTQPAVSTEPAPSAPADVPQPPPPPEPAATADLPVADEASEEPAAGEADAPADPGTHADEPDETTSTGAP